jgi:hypothetical protein
MFPTKNLLYFPKNRLQRRFLILKKKNTPRFVVHFKQFSKSKKLDNGKFGQYNTAYTLAARRMVLPN